MDLCMYTTALNLLHLKGFLQFVRPENKARVFVSLQQHDEALRVVSLMDYRTICMNPFLIEVEDASCYTPTYVKFTKLKAMCCMTMILKKKRNDKKN